MADTQATKTTETEKPEMMFEQPIERAEDHPEVSDTDPAPRHEISDEDRDQHVASLRQIAQNIRNRNDQDTNRMLDGMTRHLDALDGNPEEREARRMEAEQAKAREEKRREDANSV